MLTASTPLPNLMRSLSLPELISPFMLVGSLVAEPRAPQDTRAAEAGRFPRVEIANVFEPPGESNVRSSFQLGEGVGLIGTEETGDIYKTEDDGMTWRKVWDGGDVWDIQDVRNYVRAQDGHLYITTSEPRPALIARSTDEGESWQIVARTEASRTVGLVELDSGTMLVGLRRSENDRTSIVRSEDQFESFDWTKVSADGPRQNVTCFGYWGGDDIWAGVGYEGSGKVFHSQDEGRTWKQQADLPDARDLMDFFRDGEHIYVMASGVSTLFASADRGQTWTAARQFWSKGFLGQCLPFAWNGRKYWAATATDQRTKPFRHVVLISDDPAGEWFEWIELARDQTGGASNLARLSEHTLVVGTGNHSAQGKAYTLKLSD